MYLLRSLMPGTDIELAVSLLILLLIFAHMVNDLHTCVVTYGLGIFRPLSTLIFCVYLNL